MTNSRLISDADRPAFQLAFFLPASFFWSLGLMSFFLLYNLYLSELGVSTAMMGQIFAAGTIGTVLASTIVGWVVDRSGARITLILSAALVAASLLLRVLVTTPALMLTTSFGTGVGIAFWIVAVPPFLAAILGQRGHNTLSGFAATYGLSILTGSVAGIGIGTLSGWFGLRRSLLACGICCAVAIPFLLGIRGFPKAAPAARSNDRFAAVIREHRPFLVPFLVMVLVWDLVLGAFPPFFNVFFSHRHHFEVAEIGTLFSVAQLLQALAVFSLPFWLSRIGLQRTIAGCQFFSFPCFLLLALSSKTSWASGAYLGAVTLQALTSPLVDQFLVANVRQEACGRLTGLKFFVSQSAVAIAAAASGALIDRHGYGMTLAATSALALVSVIFTLRIRSNTQPNVV